MGCFLVLWISFGYITGTNSQVEDGPTWAALSAGYIIAGLVCGVVVGILRPLLTSFLRSVLLGPVIALPLYLTVYAAAGEHFTKWDAVDWTILSVTVIVVGTITGGIYWSIFTRSSND